MKIQFPGGSGGKESACNTGDLGLIPGLGRSPRGGHGYQYSWLENPQGQRSLEGYNPRGSQRVGHNWATKHSTAKKFITTKVDLQEMLQGIPYV